MLQRKPAMDVLGMTEFQLESCKLGLMPAVNIARIITPALPHPEARQGVPRCELYLEVKNASAICALAEEAGATIVSPLTDRDWGHKVAYYADPDGHVIAIAQPL